MNSDEINAMVLKDIEKRIDLFNYLISNWSYTGYNPKGKFYNVSFTIKDEDVMNQLNEFIDIGVCIEI